MTNPMTEIIEARETAREAGDPLADVCFLGTVDNEVAALRALALREIDGNGVGIVINATSPKWKQMSIGERVGLLMFWPAVGRQYRVTGVVALMSAEELDRAWAKKTRRARLLEHYYEHFDVQSSEIEGRDVLERGMAELERRFEGVDEVPKPDTVVGLKVKPVEIECWHDRTDRLHDRWLWRLDGEEWSKRRLVP